MKFTWVEEYYLMFAEDDVSFCDYVNVDVFIYNFL